MDSNVNIYIKQMIYYLLGAGWEMDGWIERSVSSSVCSESTRMEFIGRL